MLEAHGRSADAGTRYERYEIVTAPYTTDATKLAPRRLRSESGSWFGTAPFVVGCGHAARYDSFHLRVVRLSDGFSWLLDSTKSEWSWTSPVAITCDEVFAWASENGLHRLARFRIDSLGPGAPPD